MEVVPELSGDRASKKARLDAQLEDGRQADIAAALPSYQAGHGALTAGSPKKMQIHEGRQHWAEAAAHSTGRVHGGMQSDLADIPLHNDRDAQAGADKEQQLQQQEKLPLSMLSKQDDAAHELPAARPAEELPTANGMQQGASSESSSEAESSSEEDSLPGKGPTSPSATAQHPPLAGQQQQQQQTGAPQPAAHGLVKPGDAQSSRYSEEESGSSSEEHDVRPDPELSNPAHLLPAPTQEAQDLAPRHGAAHRPGTEEQGSSSEDDSPSSSSSPLAQQHPVRNAPVQAQQTGQQKAGANGMAHNHDSSGEVDREGSAGEGRSEAPPEQDSKQAAQDQAKQGALGANKSSSSTSSGSEDEGRGMPDLALRSNTQRQHELALMSGGGAAKSKLPQQPDSKAAAPQQQVPNKAAPTQHGPWGVAAKDEGSSSSSSEESESSDSEQPPQAAAGLGQIDSIEKQPSAQAASHRAGHGDGAALQEQFTPVARCTRQGARAGQEAEGHAPANGGKSAAHVDGSSSESEDETTPRWRPLRA